MLLRIARLCVVLASITSVALAGGPAFVAGAAFDSLVKGQSIVWANRTIQYFTDQGDLSPVLPGPQADAFVASAFSAWTSISGVALVASRAGYLAEDVTGLDVACDEHGNCSLPPDIQPGAITTPLAIVYDYDGTVTDALLGDGAGSPDYCFSNAVYGGPDNFSSDAHITHALVVMNGVCATSNAQLPDVQYRLERTLGRVIGLEWSQANLNVQTGKPHPTQDDFEGFPLMHYQDSAACVPITLCYGPDSLLPKMDDRAALRRLYPTEDGQFPQIESNLPAVSRIHGSVYFTDASGNRVQPMQGVNVVARWIDGSGKPSRRYVVTSVSGFSFRGNAGNIINGYTDSRGFRFDQFGSDDSIVEGSFDLDGLEIPDGSNTAQYQLSVEAIDSLWSLGVGPYASPVDPTWYFGIAPGLFSQVAPSGQFTPMIVTVQAGGDVVQDILMQNSEQTQPHPGAGSTYTSPATLPKSGSWGSWISGYDEADFFQFTARADRTASITVTALDEAGHPANNKLMPVVGVWEFSDQSGDPAPAATPMAFNTINLGTTRLDAQFSTTETYRLGIADLRGDGRPDYHYVASLLYSDGVTPTRVGLQGGPVTLNGIGFRPGLEATVGGNPSTVFSIAATQMEIAAPPGTQDGPATIKVTDPTTGAFSEMSNVITYGAIDSDLLLLVQGLEPATPVGAVAANPIRVRAVAADGITPVWGATVEWSTTSGTLLGACGWTSGCQALSDESGEASTLAIPSVVGSSLITAKLAPKIFQSPPMQQITLVATESSLDIAGVPPTQWVAQGATIDVPLTARVLKSGMPQSGEPLNFQLMAGAATLSASSARTDQSGAATVTAHLVRHSGDVRVSACIAPGNSPCVTFTLFATPASMWTLEPVSGTRQIINAGEPFQPLVLRVSDGTPADNVILGAGVVFDLMFVRGGPGGSGGGGEGVQQDGGTPVILREYETQLPSDANGWVSLVPSLEGIAGPCDVYIAVQSGNSQLQFTFEADSTMLGGVVSLATGKTKPVTQSGNMRSSE